MEQKNPVRETTLEVVKRAKSVWINHEKITELAKKWIREKVEVPLRPAEDILDTNDKRKILDYLFILDTLNFCFWPSFSAGWRIRKARPFFKSEFLNRRVQKEKWNIKYQGKRINGYFAFSLALKKFFEEKPEQAELKNLAKISFRDFCNIFKGRGELQFLKKRWQMAKETSALIIKKYNGDSRLFVESAGHKLSVFIPKVIKELKSFNDVAWYGGKKIYLLKRAQILAADICFAFSNKRAGYFKDLDYLTVMPDYKLPQIFRHFGILEYSAGLAERIDSKILIKAGSKEEVEIRAATVWAAEYLKDELGKYNKRLYAYEIDWILWDKSQKIRIKKPYHLTKSIFY